MVYVTGDTHAEFKRFSVKNFPEQKNMTRDDTVIILGDFGGIWSNSKEENANLKWLSEKPFTICFVDGNHENYDRLYSNEFDTVFFHGGKAQQIRDNIFHILRGYIYDFEGRKFFCMGGAKSHDVQDGILNIEDFDSIKDFLRVYKQMEKEDKFFRVNHISWWKEELPSQGEMDFGRQNLEEHGWNVDYVITHCLPQDIASAAGFTEPDSLTMYFNTLLQSGLNFRRWYCGHYHFDTPILGKFVVKYYDIERII